MNTNKMMKKLIITAAAAIVCSTAMALQYSSVVLYKIAAPSGFEVASKRCDMYAYTTDPTEARLLKSDLAWGGSTWYDDTTVYDVVQYESGENFYWVFTYTLADGTSTTINTLDGDLGYYSQQMGMYGTWYNDDRNGAWTSYFSDTSNWSGFGDATGAINAPEPTSGLLMLLGVAGLALKRKRA